MKQYELRNLVLPKWPQMIVTGEKLSEEQALEIIRRTDSALNGYFIGGNDKEYEKWLQAVCKIPDIDDYGEYQIYAAERDMWASKWGVIATGYVHNSWVVSSYIGGPYGWCHPDGTIGYSDNIGKWPSVEDVEEEWRTLAEEFPFLQIEVSLMSGEYCENNTYPIVSMLIRDGSVELVDPKERNLHKEFGRTIPAAAGDTFVYDLFNHKQERGISKEQIRKWAKQVFGDEK